jgi:hypothetical protein
MSDQFTELRNKLYEDHFDHLITTHDTYVRTRRQGVQIGNWPQSEITRAQFPLVLSAPDGYDSIPWNPLTWERFTLGNLAAYEQAYVDMKQDLLALGSVSRTHMHEYRSYQRVRLNPFVSLDEWDNFINVFYPSKDPAIGANYSGSMITLALPEHTSVMYDILQILEFFIRSPLLTCEIFANGLGASGLPIPMLFQRDTIRDHIFVSTNSLRAYIATPPVPPLVKLRILRVMFRTAGRHRQQTDMHTWKERRFGAGMNIVFDRRDKRDWMDEKKSEYRRILGTRGMTRWNKERRRRADIMQSLDDAGMDHWDIKSWELTFSVK